MKLTQEDVKSLRDLKWFASRPVTRPADFNARLIVKENALSPAARHWWREKSSDDLKHELSLWKNEYRIEETQAGFRAFRYNRSRRKYNKRAVQGGLMQKELVHFSRLIRIARKGSLV